MAGKKIKEVEEIKTGNGVVGKAILAILLIVSLVGWLGTYQKYSKVKKELATASDPAKQQERAKAEVKELVNQVAKLLVLPEGEPSIATIMDSQALAKEQPFFQNAQNGDKVLIYKDKAIIYNPTENKIVNVGPVYLSGGQTPTTEAAVAPATIEIRNGSKKIGVANDLSDKLKSKGFEVGKVANAAKTSYQGTTLVNFSTKDVSTLEAELGVKAVNALPEGETTSTLDALIILGN